VQNWNDGKVQEFQDRKEYQPDNSQLEGRRLCDRESPDAPAPAEATASQDARLLLFTTKTCPNCRIAKAELDKAQLSYDVLDAAENVQLVKQYGITQAPTLMVVNGDNAQKFAGAGAIKRFAVENRK
jgi:ribonucleoside-triphosphate reductase